MITKVIKADNRYKILLKAKKANILYCFFNREGDELTKCFTSKELRAYIKPYGVGAFINRYNIEKNREIEEEEKKYIKLLRNKGLFENIDSYHVKLKKLSNMIREKIDGKIGYLGIIKR